MPITINGSGTVTGIAVGGLPDGIVDTDMIANNAVTSAKSTISGGISECDRWRLSAELTGNGLPISSNLERCDNSSYTKIGTGMSQSSGVFTYPATGIWKVIWDGYIEIDTASHKCTMTIENTVNNGTNWVSDSRVKLTCPKVTTTSYNHFQVSCIFDVTDTSNCKTRFEHIAGLGSEVLQGDSGQDWTTFEFIKLAET